MSNNNGNAERMGEISKIEDRDKILAESIEEKIRPKPLQQPCIFKVSPILQQGKEEFFLPQAVSIGPFHRGKENLRIMEERKKWHLHASLSRNKAKLEEWVKAMRDMEEKARECYAESINLSSEEFIEMMLLDGCFILELFYRKASEVEVEVNENDTTSFSSWMVNRLAVDFILLENQLPFFILERLFNLTRVSKEGNCSLYKLVLHFFEDMLPTALTQIPVNSRIDFKHILDLIRNILLPVNTVEDVEDSSIWQYTYSATDLWESGVNFKKKDNKNGGMLDITFNADTGVLEIPPFYLGKTTICLLQNLIALEEYGRDFRSPITSYVTFLDILVDSPKDVRLLCDKEIMKTDKDHEEVVRAINVLGKGINNPDFYYDGLHHRVNKYWKSRVGKYHRTDWHGWRADLMHNYFNTPWSAISVVAAFILLVLTFLQTVFSILSY